jgi:putative two-component system response regulator
MIAEENANSNEGEIHMDSNQEETAPADEKLCILAIDDARDTLTSVYHILHNEYKVYTLPQPEMLENFLKRIKPDLFLLDYKMPGMSGFDLIPIIRRFNEHKHTPIIFLTSEGTIDNLSASIALGACDFIVKPFDPNILSEKIAKHIKK